MKEQVAPKPVRKKPEESRPEDSTKSVRDRLRSGAELQSERIEDFFSQALDAEKKIWTTCQKCSRKIGVVVPDWSARLRAVEALLDQGYGRTAAVQADEQPTVIIVERIWPGLSEQMRAQLTDEEVVRIENARALYTRASQAATHAAIAATEAVRQH